MSFRWGCEHEIDGRNSYAVKQQHTHEGFSIQDSGLCINITYPHLGASADAIVSCRCCGKGVVEIKCPFCARNASVTENTVECLENVNGVLHLKKDHAYYYQVQMQLFLYDVTYCDFVVWTCKGKDAPHVERIAPNVPFFEKELEKVNIFYKHVILPNLLSKNILAPVQVVETSVNDICLCREPPSGEILFCKSGFCKITQYHKDCIKLVKVPKRYICPACRTQINKEKRDLKKQSQSASR